jgi:hypothetical protein
MSRVTAVFLIVVALAAVSLLGQRGRLGRCCGDPYHRVTEDSEIGYCPTSDGRPLLVAVPRPRGSGVVIMTAPAQWSGAETHTRIALLPSVTQSLAGNRGPTR